ncbi:MAG TPA: sugar phosphate isomerase/epimerase [Micromonosporaceae bacterium]|nr:sugar phosphate isomerase/epimerase [Micromonosporaceae bacterium]
MTSSPEAGPGQRASEVPVLLSTSSVYPEPTTAAFEVAANLGYDGVEVMVWTDGASQHARTLSRLAEHYRMPVLAVHAPCLLVTQRVWSPDPWERLRRAAELAGELGAPTVVVHPPFIWQRDYAKTFRTGLDTLSDQYPDVRIAVENMYPVRMGRRQFVPYSPHWDPTTVGYQYYTLDASHCAASRIDALAMAQRMGDAIGHLHLGDGNGEGRDEHLVPGRGSQPCGAVLEHLAANGYGGSVSVEVNTRKVGSREQREADLAESLAFARRHLSTAAAATS